MLVFHFSNIILFFPQYIAATLFAILVFILLTRAAKVFSRSGFTYRLRLGTSNFSSSIKWNSEVARPVLILSGKDLSSMFLKNHSEPLYMSLQCYYSWNGYPSDFYAKLSTDLKRSRPYGNSFSFLTYRIFFTVAAWEGVLMLFTPFKYIGVFIPHISTDIDIIIGLIIGISIFESSISTIFLFSGINTKKILVVMLLVTAIFSVSLLTPSMSWFSLYNEVGKVTYFSVILGLILAITGLIPQLKTSRNLYLSAYSFSIISYLAFIFTIIINLIH